MEYKNKDEIEHICLSIRLARIIKGITQEELGNKVGLKKSQISKLERSKSLINTDLLISIAKILSVAPEDLFPKVKGNALSPFGKQGILSFFEFSHKEKQNLVYVLLD